MIRATVEYDPHSYFDVGAEFEVPTHSITCFSRQEDGTVLLAVANGMILRTSARVPLVRELIEKHKQ